MNRSVFKGFQFTDGMILFALIFVGGFHEYVSCILSAAMVLWLLLRLAEGKTIQIEKNLYFGVAAVLCLGYGITCLWAVDHGMAFVGFLKFLPLGLYPICLCQNEEEGKILQILPYFGIFSIIISGVGMQIPRLAGYFSVDGRIAGFFQYPNTFAIFLLVCQLLVLKKEKKTLLDYAVILALTGGIFYSGSRIVLALFLVSNIAMLFICLPKKGRIPMAISLFSLLLVGFLLALDENSVLNRYQIVSLMKTSLVDRALYMLDSLPLLLKYPFGMGYMGYFYAQKTAQTGIYATTFVHNDFLQVFLDIGWIPGLLLMVSLVRWFLKKNISPADKILVGTLCLHALLDFDLQYMAMAMLLLLLTYRKTGEKTLVLQDTLGLKSVLTVVMALSLYMATALGLPRMGQRLLADTLYPYNTANMLVLLEDAGDMREANALADRIISQNQSYHAAYEIKAKYCYSRGDFAGLIQNKNKVFQANPFGYGQYQEYCEMLIAGIDLYQQAGDWDSVRICREELVSAQAKLTANADRLSALGKYLSVQPVTQLSESVREYIAAIGGNDS